MNDIVQENVSKLVDVLLNAARNSSAVPYNKIYEIFGDKNNNVWTTFDAAEKRLAPLDKYIFGALLSNNNGIPGKGFYEKYKKKKKKEFTNIVNEEKNYNELSDEEKIEIVTKERELIYGSCTTMYPVKHFRSSDDNNAIASEVVIRGLALISGGRIEVRNKEKEVQKILSEQYDIKVAPLTYNHPETELGYIFRFDFYDMSEAKKTAIEIYNAYYS